MVQRPLLLQAIPNLAQALDSFLRVWRGEPVELGVEHGWPGLRWLFGNAKTDDRVYVPEDEQEESEMIL